MLFGLNGGEYAMHKMWLTYKMWWDGIDIPICNC